MSEYALFRLYLSSCYVTFQADIFRQFSAHLQSMWTFSSTAVKLLPQVKLHLAPYSTVWLSTFMPMCRKFALVLLSCIPMLTSVILTLVFKRQFHSCIYFRLRFVCTLVHVWWRHVSWFLRFRRWTHWPPSFHSAPCCWSAPSKMLTMILWVNTLEFTHTHTLTLATSYQRFCSF